MNLIKKYNDYMARAKDLLATGDALEAEVARLRRNPADVNDLIYSGYITARMEDAREYARGLLDAAENILKMRAKELGVEIKL